MYGHAYGRCRIVPCKTGDQVHTISFNSCQPLLKKANTISYELLTGLGPESNANCTNETLLQNKHYVVFETKQASICLALNW